MKSKSLKFFYHQAQINFLLNPVNSEIMINATQMAKVFDKRIDVFLKTDSTKEYIKILQQLPKDEKLWRTFTDILPPFGGNNEDYHDDIKQNDNLFPPFGGNKNEQDQQNIILLTEKDIIQSRSKNGTWMHRLLAIEFAAWLDPAFKLWINIVIDNVMFGNYKKHWEAHATQEEAKERMRFLKAKMLTNVTQESTIEYFEMVEVMKQATADKRKAIQGQSHLFNYLQQSN